MKNSIEDCSNCKALCCFVLEITEKNGGFDKPANTACPNLNIQTLQCNIWNQLEEKGYKACIGSRCYGLGVKVSKELAEQQINWLDGNPTSIKKTSDFFIDAYSEGEEIFADSLSFIERINWRIGGWIMRKMGL